MSTPVAPLARSSAVHVLFGFVAMGGWAAFANRAHPMPAPLLAGMIQGGLSACITLFLKRVIEALSLRLDGIGGVLVPPVTTCLVSATLLALIHALSGTPEVLATIVLPLTVATSYAALYNFSLWKAGRR
jgi:fructose-specific phosphotransferase system IIC component